MTHWVEYDWVRLSYERVKNPENHRSKALARPKQRAVLMDTNRSTTKRPRALYAMCVRCRVVVHDWRQLLGVGAEILASTPDGDRITIRHPRACFKCGGSDLAVTADVVIDSKGGVSLKGQAASGDARIKSAA